MFEDITLLFCFVDDFCKECAKQMRNYLIENNKKMHKPTRVSELKMSEIITIILMFYRSNIMNFKAFYKYLELHHKRDFPKMPTYERFCVIKQKAIPMLLCIFKCLLSKGQSEAYIDATALRVSHNKRTNSHKVFKGLAAVGKSTMGFYGFKLHLVIDLQGNIINAKLTNGNCDDRSPVEDLLQEFQGVIYSDKDYISKDLFSRLWKKGVKLVTGVKANMKNKLMILKEKILLRKRSLIESVFSILKRNGLEHSRHRSVHGFILHILGSLVSYQLNRKKPGISDGFSLPNP